MSDPTSPGPAHGADRVASRAGIRDAAGVRPRRAGARTRGGARQRGAAIETAILVVTLASILVSSLFYRESVAVRSIENRRSLSQVRWVERAVIDWAQVILRTDNTPAYDHPPTELWGTPVVDAQFDEAMAGGARIGDELRSASLAGAITDAQARFNVNSLVQPDSLVESTAHVAMLGRLMEQLGLPASLVEALVLRIRQSRARVVDGRFVPAARMPLARFGDLRDVPGIDEAALQKLQPHVTVLPDDVRTVNLNTASAEVIAASLSGLSLSTAKQFVAQRERLAVVSIDDANTKLGNNAASGGLNQQLLSVNTRYFFVTGSVRYDRVESRTETLLRREGTGPTGRVQVIWQHRN